MSASLPSVSSCSESGPALHLANLFGSNNIEGTIRVWSLSADCVPYDCYGIAFLDGAALATVLYNKSPATDQKRWP
jgi:hypothetical protein